MKMQELEKYGENKPRRVMKRFALTPKYIKNDGAIKSFKEQFQDDCFDKSTPYLVSIDSLGVTNIDLPIVINSEVLKKVFEKHGIKEYELYNLADRMKNFMLVSKSQNRDDSIIIFVDQNDRNNNPLMISLALNQKTNTYKVNKITSVYVRTNAKKFIEKLYDNNLVLKENKKIKQWLRTIGVQFSKDTSTTLIDNSITSKKCDVNTSKEYSIHGSNKNIFFVEEEVCTQYSVNKKEYVFVIYNKHIGLLMLIGQ